MDIKSDRGRNNMFDEEKKEFISWWGLVLILCVFTVVVLTATGYMGKIFGTAVEREVFEQSYQKQAGDSQRLATYRAQLAQINVRLSSETDQSIIQELKAQKAMLEVQINTSRN